MIYKKILEKEVIEYFEKILDIDTLITNHSQVLLLSKKRILPSDESGKSQGSLFIGKLLTPNIMQDIFAEFNSFKIFFEKKPLADVKQLEYINGRVTYANSYKNNQINTIVDFYNPLNRYIFSVDLVSKRDIYQGGLYQLIYFDLIILVLLSILLFILYKVQNIQDEKLRYQDEIKSRFLANISHELRTPINAIQGFTDILYTQESDEKKKDILQIINNSVKQMVFMINDILDFSQIEKEKFSIVYKEFDLEKTLNELADIIRYFTDQKQISFVQNFSNLSKIVLGDEKRLSQIIMNLLSNASKFTPYKGKVKFNANYNDNDKKLYISVEDDGIGIEKKDFDIIFKRFEKSNNAIHYYGAGLGLAISLKLVQLLGGDKIDLESELFKGSKFSFSIPLEVIPQSQKIEKKKKYDFLGLKILVAEDNLTNQKFISILLDKTHIKYDLANDGVEALNLFKTKHYDMVLMDENMPQMNGIETTKKIREYEKDSNLNHTPIIAVTADVIYKSREKFLKAGMDGYISKPFKKETLFETIDSLIIT